MIARRVIADGPFEGFRSVAIDTLLMRDFILHENRLRRCFAEGSRRDCRATQGMAMLPDGVSWTQDDESIEVTVAVAEASLRADLHVYTTTDTLRVQMRTDGVWRPLLMGSLLNSVEATSCCWSIEKTKRGSGKAVVIQLEKAAEASWESLLRADAAGSILEELGRDQVIADAGADTESSVCGRCGALVKRSRMEAHATMWCEALAETDACPEPDVKSPASHLFWASTPTLPEGTVPPRKLEDEVLV